LIELMLAMTLVAFLSGLAFVNVNETVRRARLDNDVGRFTRTLRTAADYAAYSGKTVAVVLDVTDGYYTVYEANAKDSYDDMDIEPIMEQQALDWCYIEEVELEDGSKQYSGEIILHVTPRGWGASVLFYLLDDRNNLHRFVRCDRFTPRVVQSRTPVYLLETHEELSLSMPI